MAADNVVNGITKIEREGVFIYSFPLGTITANNGNNTITYELITPAIRNETVSFDDITDKKGATTPEEYVDQLATDGIFFSPDSDSGDITGTVTVDNFPDPQNVDVQNFPASQTVDGTVKVDQSEYLAGSGKVETDFEVSLLDAVSQSNLLLEKILFELKRINS